jgi:hypothetical protein
MKLRLVSQLIKSVNMEMQPLFLAHYATAFQETNVWVKPPTWEMQWTWPQGWRPLGARQKERRNTKSAGSFVVCHFTAADTKTEFMGMFSNKSWTRLICVKKVLRSRSFVMCIIAKNFLPFHYISVPLQQHHSGAVQHDEWAPMAVAVAEISFCYAGNAHAATRSVNFSYEFHSMLMYYILRHLPKLHQLQSVNPGENLRPWLCVSELLFTIHYHNFVHVQALHYYVEIFMFPAPNQWPMNCARLR